MDKDTRAEISALWKKINDIGKSQSDFTVSKADGVKAINGKEWNANKIYEDDDIVLYRDSFARCLHANKGIDPTNKVYWELVTVSDMILELIERVSAFEEQKGE